MPLETMRSAALRMSASVTLPANQFQLFQPMGGVAASCCAESGREATKKARIKRRQRRMQESPRKIVFVDGTMRRTGGGGCQTGAATAGARVEGCRRRR